MAVMGSPSLISLMVFVDIKHHVYLLTINKETAQELCESRGGRHWLPVPNKPYDFCGRKATLNLIENEIPGPPLLLQTRGGYCLYESAR